MGVLAEDSLVSIDDPAVYTNYGVFGYVLSVKCDATFWSTSFEDETSARVDAECFIGDCKPETEHGVSPKQRRL